MFIEEAAASGSQDGLHRERWLFVIWGDLTLTDSMSADEIQQIITNAILAADEAKKQNEREQKERERCELRDIIGYKEYEDENGIIRYVLLFFNRTSMIVKLLFAPKRVIKGDETTFGLLKMFVEMILWMTEYITMMFSFVSAIYIYHYNMWLR